jgi:glycine hydroxymethyltransferase
MRQDEMKIIGGWMLEALKSPEDAAAQRRIRGQVSEMCERFPVPAAAFDEAPQ